jgi:hypothetical protein
LTTLALTLYGARLPLLAALLAVVAALAWTVIAELRRKD